MSINTEGEHMTVATWAEAIELEPRLIDLQQRAIEAGQTTTEADYWDTYELLKSDLRSMVGWGAAAPELRTCDAYIVGHGQTCGRFESTYHELHREV